MEQNYPDYYAILQVHPDAEPEVIQAAYYRLARKYHPDVNPSPEAQEWMAQLNAAYAVLCDPAKRAEYDSEYDKWVEETWHTREEPQATAGRDLSQASNSLRRWILMSTLRGAIVALTIFITLWSILATFVPEGWPMAAVNIPFFIFSVGLAVHLKNLLNLALPRWGAWVLTLSMYLLFVMVIRPIEISAFQSLFGQDEPRVSAAQDYLSDLDPILEPVADAQEKWTSLVEAHAQVAGPELTREQAVTMVQDELTAATHAYNATGEALKALQAMTPPKQCQEWHLKLMESLQLSERGFMDLASAMTLALKGLKSDERFETGNRLLNEADRVKNQALIAMEDCK